jgi:hypothetical protein
MSINQAQSTVFSQTGSPGLQSTGSRQLDNQNLNAANDSSIPNSDQSLTGDFHGLLNLIGGIVLLLSSAGALDRAAGTGFNHFHPSLIGMHHSGHQNPYQGFGNFLSALAQLGQGAGANNHKAAPPPALTVSERLASAQTNLSQQEHAADAELENLAALRGRTVGDSNDGSSAEARYQRVLERHEAELRTLKTEKIAALTTNDKATLRENDHKMALLEREKAAYQEIYNQDPSAKELARAEKEVLRIRELMDKKREIAQLINPETVPKSSQGMLGILGLNRKKDQSHSAPPPDHLREAMLAINDELRSLAGHRS